MQAQQASTYNGSTFLNLGLERCCSLAEYSGFADARQQKSFTFSVIDATGLMILTEECSLENKVQNTVIPACALPTASFACPTLRANASSARFTLASERAIVQQLNDASSYACCVLSNSTTTVEIARLIGEMLHASQRLQCMGATVYIPLIPTKKNKIYVFDGSAWILLLKVLEQSASLTLVTS